MESEPFLPLRHPGGGAGEFRRGGSAPAFAHLLQDINALWGSACKNPDLTGFGAQI
jgi:hypothetical protein